MQLTAAMVGMLGGPALMVWTVLQIERQPRSLSFLCDMANLSDKTGAAAVRKLKTLGMITETGRYIYQIADGVEQLPLPAEELTEGVVEEGNLGRKFSDLDINESMNESMIEIIKDDSSIDSLEIGNSDLVTAKALKTCGFYGRVLTELPAVPGLTMREVRYHVQTAPSLGAALSRIRKRQPAPAGWENGRERDGPDRRRYIEGEYADFIKH